jgi:hypothetical protein
MEVPMNCFECAKASETTPAVAVCQHCGVGLCFEHLVEATHALVGGTHEGCQHKVPLAAPTVNGRAETAVIA